MLLMIILFLKAPEKGFLTVRDGGRLFFVQDFEG